MTAEELTAWKAIAAIIGSTVMGAYLAWKARGRKDLSAPYTPDNDSQPRVVTRKEWHDVVDIQNAWPGLTARVKRLEGRMTDAEREFAEHLRATGKGMESLARLEERFAAHVDRWEEVGIEARDHRQRLEAQLLRLEEKVERH